MRALCCVSYISLVPCSSIAGEKSLNPFSINELLSFIPFQLKSIYPDAGTAGKADAPSIL